jgi:hypothetical protein
MICYLFLKFLNAYISEKFPFPFARGKAKGFAYAVDSAPAKPQTLRRQTANGERRTANA